MNTYDILNMTNGLQPQAQSNLPVIPNNGNPNTIYNMPATGSSNMPPMPATVPTPTAPPTQPPVATPTGTGQANPYPWLGPSMHMGLIQQWLQNRQQRLFNPLVP